MRTYTLLGLLLLLWMPLPAQAPQIERLPANLEVAELPVPSILSSQSGFMWFGTWFGLYRYDGYTLKEYLPRADWDGKPVHAYKISCLFEDRKGILWIGLYTGGVFRFDPVTGESRVYQQRKNDPATLSNNTVHCLAEDQQGNIWVGTKEGLNCLNPATGRVQRFWAQPGNPAALQNNQIRSLCVGRDGTLWVGTYRGLARMQVSASGASVVQHFFLTPAADSAVPEVESPDDFIFTLLEDKHHDGVFWIGTKGGLKRLDVNQPSLAAGLSHFKAQPGGLSDNFVETVLETTEGPNQILWIGTYNGLCRLEVASGTFSTFLPRRGDPGSLNDNVVISLASDRTGLVWVGTNKGVNKINPAPKPFRHLNFGSSNENNLWALTGSSRNGTEIWAGSAGGGLKQITARGKEFSARSVSLTQLTGQPQANFIYDLHLDAEGWLWIATRGAGIIRYPTRGNGAWERFSSRSHQLADNFVMCVHEDAAGRLWFGSWEGGLMCFDRKTRQFSNFKTLPNTDLRLSDFPLVEIYSVPGTGGQTELWIGTRGGGLFQVRVDANGQLTQLENQYSLAAPGARHLSSDNITCIKQGPDGRLWVATEDGLNQWDKTTQKFVSWTLAEGLPDRIIQTICFDGPQKAWISTGKGIAQLLFNEQCRLLNVRSFDQSDGLPTNLFHDGSGWISPEGWLFFGSYEGLCYFPGAQIRENLQPPTVVLSGLTVFNKAVDIGPRADGAPILSKDINFAGHINLAYADNVFSIQFAALDFLEPRKNRYAYRLLGFHDEWVYVDAGNREAHFTNLSEGDYTLEVKAANHDGMWSTEPKRLTISVMPPFYRSIWAYLLYGMAIAGVVYWYRRMELARVELKNQVKFETLRREKTEEVERMKVRFFTHISHELKTPLTLILSPLEDLLKGKLPPADTHDIYAVMHRNANRLHQLINQILILRKTEEGLMKLSVEQRDLVLFLRDICVAFRDLAQSHHVDFRFLSTEETLVLWYDREQLEKVLYNLLSNAFKFTEKGGRITVRLDTSDQQARIVVEDDGKGIDPAEQARVFELFYTGKANAALPHHPGTGIGLALTKSIVDLHGGSIQVESEGVGTGSRFTVLLPLGNAHFKPDDLVQPAPADEAEALPALSSKVPSSGTDPDAAGKELPLVLVVDDHPDIRAYIRVRLQGAYAVEEAGGGLEAWEKTKELVPDLVISDILMPDLNGLDLCRNIKTDPLTSHIPVVLLTAKGNTSTQIDGLEAGADAYLAKPFDPELLLAGIRNLILAQERLQKHFQHGTHLPLKELDISHLDQQFLEKCMDYIERHLADPDYSVEQLGKTLFMSRMQLYRKIKALTGDSPNHFIRTIRLNRAAQLLEKGFSVAEVTYQVGFQDLKYFRESFRKQFKVNPSEYGAKRKI
ncbi:MAG: response regulator [Saprospiraceae bacterium]|nr:response regulator [Saprospiraceae bacterium]